ncbi:MAG: tyrosine-protein phosphatase [Tepidiformaceae bacterium]
MTLTISKRELRLEVAHNVRHIGGYEGTRGTTSDSIVRSAGLQRLTEGGLGALADAGITTIIDLRSSVERSEQGSPDVSRFGIRALHNPIWEADASPAGLGEGFAGYAPIYRSMLASGAPAYRLLFETIAQSDGGVLFHCAAGKDRTGVAAALMLKLVGVAESEIIEDFALSETLLAPMFAEFAPRMAERGINAEKARMLMASDPAAITDTLEHLRETHGGAEGYMRHIGMSGTAVSALQARLIA